MITRLVPWVALLIALSIVAVHSHFLQTPRWIPDDTYITLRFAHHFAAGHGIVYNPGERVEGYTNFLWLLLLGVLHRAGGDLEILCQYLGIVFSAATLILLAMAHRVVPGLKPGASAAAVLLAGSSAVFTTYVMAGMEAPMVHFWITLALLLHFRSQRLPEERWLPAWVGMCCAFAAMSRPDAGILFPVLFADRLVQLLRGKGWHAVPFGAAFTAVFGVYFLWRYAYYGYLLPNTFYAKVGGEWDQALQGLDYLARFAGGVFITLALAFGALLLPARQFPDARMRGVLLGYMVLHAAYVVVVGGDFMPAFRFFATIYPAIALLAGLTLSASGLRWAAVSAVLVCAVSYNLIMMPGQRDMRRAAQGMVSARGIVVGAWLRKHAPPGALLATNTAGSIPYYSGLRTIDMLGLCDATIAHRDMKLGRRTPGHGKGDGAYVLSRKPDFIQFGSASGAEQPVFPGDREIFSAQEFRRNYVLKRFRLPNGITLRIYERKEAAGGRPIQAKPVSSRAF